MDESDQAGALGAARARLAARRRPTGREEAFVPVSAYLDPSRYDAERALHRRRLHLVAHRSEVAAPGDFLTLDVAGSPVLVVRGDDGAVRAFLNVCRHRGARVERRSSGHCKRFVCPYHAWTYRRDGALAHVRHPEGFPSVADRSMGLTALACVEDGPFVWVCPTPGVEARLDEGARRLVAEFDALGLGGLAAFERVSTVWKANWKLLVEGGLESYHFKIAHRSTIGPMFTDTQSTFEVHGDHLRSVLPRASVADAADGASLLAHANLLYHFAPNASVLVQDGHFALISMTPVAIDATRIDLVTVGRPVPEQGGERVRAFLRANHDFTVKTLEEDFVLAEEIQRGLGSGANEVLRFGRYEDALTTWHELLDAALCGGGPAVASAPRASRSGLVE